MDTQPELINRQVTPRRYSSQELYTTHFLEQYKLYVESVFRLEERRMIANSFFLTLHTVVIGIAGFSFQELLNLENKWLLMVPIVAALILCYTWWRTLRSYKQLSNVKYGIIDEYEKRLPTRPFVNMEWKALKEGKDPKVYTALTGVEFWVPIIFGLLYLVGYLMVVIIGESSPSLLTVPTPP